MPETTLPFLTRIWFAWVCYFRILFDGAFAARAFAARLPAATPERTPTRTPTPALTRTPTPALTRTPTRTPASTTSALQLLSLLQREGRFVDFLEQDVAAFPDAEIGAAARVVHDGCRKALRAHATIVPVRAEDEGAKVTLDAGFSAAEVKLTGNVRGAAPYTGTLVHRGWRAKELRLPTAIDGHDASILAPAELEV